MSRPFSSVFMIVVLVSLALSWCRPGFAQTGPCGQPIEALGTTEWQSIKPSHLPFELAFSVRSGWVGLGRVFSTQKHIQRRWRTAIPFLAPTVIQSFPGPHASNSVNNPVPVFYLHATESASIYPIFDPDKLQLLRLKVQGNHREVPVSTGITTFRFAAAAPSRVLVPIFSKRLSATLIELKPQHALAPGEYLVTMGLQESDGFEFNIKCGR